MAHSVVCRAPFPAAGLLQPQSAAHSGWCLRGRCSSALAHVVTYRQVTPPCWPSRLLDVARYCGSLLRFEGNTPGGASQSPTMANTSIPAPVLAVFSGRIWNAALVRNAECEPKPSHPSQCRSLQDVMKHCHHLKGYREVRTCFFRGMEQPLEHIVIDDSDGDTIPSVQSPCACCDLCLRSRDVVQLYSSLHWCTPSTVSTQAATEISLCAPSHASCSTEASGFFSSFTSPSWVSPDVSDFCSAPMSQDGSNLFSRPTSLCGIGFSVFF